MHPVLARQLRKAGLREGSLPDDVGAFSSVLQAIDRAYAQADDDRYLLERSLALSSEEMGELHSKLAAERDVISSVICSLAEGVCAVDRKGCILFMNPEARRLLRVRHDDAVVGLKFDALVTAHFPDGRTLASVIQDPLTTHLDEQRLAAEGNENQITTCMIGPLGYASEGLVITLRDVTERTRLEVERTELHRQLVEASRRAGMAEVAAGVLHNVGNVLNSVNVSATIVTDMVKESKISAVAQLAGLLEANRSRLAEFITADPAGSRLPDFVAKLSERLGADRGRMLDELNHVRENIDHIREIVATQQNYAKNDAVGIPEPERIEALVENALRVTESSLVRHSVTVMREIDPLPPITLERHHLLQILINLITNAKRAVSARTPDDRRIIIRIKSVDGMIVVSVIDNGVGITPEHMRRVFQHGFTTDPTGHGFGLHSAALAAKSMGGTLSARSDGLDRGATFTLEFPAVPSGRRVAA